MSRGMATICVNNHHFVVDKMYFKLPRLIKKQILVKKEHDIFNIKFLFKFEYIYQVLHILEIMEKLLEFSRI